MVNSKQTFCSVLLSLFLITTSLALPDLTVTAFSINKTSIVRGDYFIATATIKNIGNQTSIASFALITIEGIKLARIATKSLATNESATLQYVFPIPSSAIVGTHSIALEVDFANFVTESNEQNNIFCPGTTTCQKLFVTSGTYLPDRKLPCPIIFIHGVNSSDKTWDKFTQNLELNYGLTKGGNLDYCLNYDGDQTKSNLLTDVKDFTNNTLRQYGVRNGDFYLVNFDVSRTGKLYVNSNWTPLDGDNSNESAITKQGYALKLAIKRIMDVTGAQEVILVGHSMGGLASREYIQNTANLQADGKHHVAKLVTVATPNGGSNYSGGIIAGLDELSEAVRDFRHPSNLHTGVFLFGGNETDPMTTYNRDINCNGISNDVRLTGLNNRLFPADIAAACVIGTGSLTVCNGSVGSNGDLVVCADRSDLNTYLSSISPRPFADRFSISATHLNIHTQNPSTLIQALDEPKTYDKAYDIPTDLAFFGSVTMQAANDPFPEPIKSTDYDDYKFILPVRSNVQIVVTNIPVHNFNAYIVNANQQVLYTFPSNKGSNISAIVTLDAGSYFLETEATPDLGSYEYPYLFGVIATPAAGPIAAFDAVLRQGCSPLSVIYSNQSTGSPTSYEWTFQGGTPTTSTLSNPTVSYTTSGTYDVVLTARNASGTNSLIRRSYVSVGRTPVGSFSYSNATTSNPLTVSFYNTSAVGVDAQYLWNFGDGTTSVENSPQHTYTRYGSFNVTLTVNNACGSATVPKTITFTTPTNEIEKTKLNFNIAPNPNDGNFTITIKQADMDLGKCKLTVFNTLGQLIHTLSIDVTSSVSLPLSMSLPNGSYIAVLSSENGKTYRKFVVQR